MNPETARTVMRDYYDQYFGIFTHTREDANPMSSNLMHTTNPYRSEDLMRQTDLVDLIRNYEREPWWSFWKLDFEQVMRLSVPMYELMRSQIPIINERRRKKNKIDGLDLDDL